VIWNVSPATTAADDANAPDHNALPADNASHNDQCVYVSVAATFVHSTVPDDAIDPPDAAANDTAFRVDSDAAFAVPSSPGSPVCNCKYVPAEAYDDPAVASNN